LATLDLESDSLHVWTDGQARDIRDVLNWSPDGRYVVYHASTKPFEADLYLADTVSGSVRNLTHDHFFSQAPAFTRDGAAVTFMSTRGGNWTWSFYLLDLATDRYTLLLGPDYTEKNYPAADERGALVWSEFDRYGREYLASREPSGDKHLLTAAGPF